MVAAMTFRNPKLHNDVGINFIGTPKRGTIHFVIGCMSEISATKSTHLQKVHFMPKFSANLSFLFNELPFMQRFGAAAAAGFKAVEYVAPYAYAADEIATALNANGLVQALFNLPAGDWERGERGLACVPGRESEFKAGVARAIEYAHVLHCPTINCLAGIRPADVTPETARATLVTNLRYAASALQRAGIRLVTEPINSFDIPGYFVNRTADALSIIDEVESGNLFIQYDVYHAQRMEGELATTLSNNIKRIGHIQIADNPGRHEPGTGEINYDWLLPHIDSLGYGGWVGCEYKPAANTVAGLQWMDAFKR
jgi:hydroxypyruvate isomerase